MNVAPKQTRDSLIESHRYLCRRTALRFLRRGLDLRDLEQVAAIGLIKASDRYDPASAAPFEAYARVMILGELMHHVRDFEHAVRIPRWLRTLERRCAEAEAQLTVTLGREPSRAELAAALGVRSASLCELERARNTMLAGAGDGYDRIAAPGALPEDKILIDRALAALPPLERRIVLGVYALGLTQAEVARRLHLGPRQVHRIHRAALDRMQSTLAPRALKRARSSV